MKKETKREALYRNESLIEKQLKDAYIHRDKVEEIRNVSEQITGVKPKSIVGETEVYEASKSEQFPYADADFVFKAMGKSELYNKWLELKKQIVKPYRYDLDDNLNVIVSERWYKELEEAYTEFVYDEEIVEYKEIDKAIKAINRAQDKVRWNIMPFVERNIENGSLQLNKFKLLHAFKEERRLIAKMDAEEHKRELAKTT